MKENFLHYIWKYKLFDASHLTTHSGDVLEIVNFGQHNTDAGPDFFNGKVKINDTVWAGNIELHINASDWTKHQHQTDRAYHNVVLHVVYNNDQTILDQVGNPIPTLELKGLIDPAIIAKHHHLINNTNAAIPCGTQIQAVDEFTIKLWLNRLAIERLERKSTAIEHTLTVNKNNWEATFYQYLLRYFGLKVNALPFELLAQKSPLPIIEKHPSIVSIEALLYGQAGYLTTELEDDYHHLLKKEYQFLKAKFDLTPMENSMWKLLRLRPSNFPTIRIAQVAHLLSRNTRLFAQVIAAKSVTELQEMFQVKASAYWNTHYQFGNAVASNKVKKLGESTINSIVINVIVPFTFVYGKAKQDEKLVDKALQLLESIKAENNVIVRNWEALGIQATNAMQTQSLIELKNNYCSHKKCLTCSIGNKILQG